MGVTFGVRELAPAVGKAACCRHREPHLGHAETVADTAGASCLGKSESKGHLVELSVVDLDTTHRPQAPNHLAPRTRSQGSYVVQSHFRFEAVQTAATVERWVGQFHAEPDGENWEERGVIISERGESYAASR
jgi:hypothetical protein